MLLVVYTIAYPPPQLPYPSPWPSNALANPTFVCQCVWKFSGLRAAWRVALSELLLPDYLLLNRRAENVKSGERRVENSVSFSDRIGWNIQRPSAEFPVHMYSHSESRLSPQRIRTLSRALLNSESPWNTLVFPCLPALLCSYSGCRPTLAQLMPLPKVLHELESCCPWGSRTSVPEPVRRASRRLYWGNDSSLGRWRRSIKKRQ